MNFKLTHQHIKYLGGFLAETVFVAICYVGAARIGFSTAIPPGNITIVWPASGLALAVVLVFGYRASVGIWVGSFLANIWFFSRHFPDFGQPAFLISSVIGIGSTVQALSSAFLIRYFIGPDNPFFDVKSIFKLLLIALGTSCIPATYDVIVMASEGLVAWSRFSYIWWTWWIGNLFGLIIVTPMLLSFHKSLLKRRMKSYVTEFGFYTLSLVVICYIVFEDGFTGQLMHYPYVVIPLVVWAAFRLGPSGICATIFIFSEIAIIGTVHGQGPFVQASLNDSLLTVQIFIAIVAMTGLLFAATLERQRRTSDALLQSEKAYRSLFEESKDIVLFTTPDGKILNINPAGVQSFGYKSKEEILSSNVQEDLYYYPFEREKFLQNMLEQGFVKDMEIAMRRKNGEKFFVLASAFPVTDDKGNVVSYRGMAHDITEHKMAHEVLQEHEKRFRSQIGRAHV